jgi:hypothetical protein
VNVIGRLQEPDHLLMDVFVAFMWVCAFGRLPFVNKLTDWMNK